MRSRQKVFLSFLLSSACILIYQYQLSNTGLNSSSSSSTLTGNVAQELTAGDEVVKLASRGLLLSNSNGTVASSTSTTTLLAPVVGVSDCCRQKCENGAEVSPLPPPLYVITPTYRRPQMLAELTRLGYTLKHVPNLYWLVVEDAAVPSLIVTKLLERIQVPFQHLAAQMPEKYRNNKIKPRGVSNRNRGLEWIRANATEGAFYFADDDNTYDIEIFNQMRYTKKLSMWPVALVTKFGLSSPIVKDGKLIGFYDGWIGGRKYPVDMAGFAVSVKFFLSRPNATMPFKPGYEEDGFLRSLGPLSNSEIELLASNCTEILTWHTQTRKYTPAAALDMKKYDKTNLVNLHSNLV